MARKKKAGTSGTAVNYVTRRKAVSMLQVDFHQFRRLCILKGVFPRSPKNKFKGADKIYYLKKDIQFLMHDPVLQTMRDRHAHDKKITKAFAKKDVAHLRVLKKATPDFNFDHLVKERYPTFVDSIRDLDDALCHIALFGASALNDPDHRAKVDECKRRINEFHLYVAKTHVLKKMFISIKGFYFQAVVWGERVTWLIPHQFLVALPKFGVDKGVMLSFLDLYLTQLRFVNFKLFASLNWVYPPRIHGDDRGGQGGLSTLMLTNTVKASQNAGKMSLKKVRQSSRAAAASLDLSKKNTSDQSLEEKLQQLAAEEESGKKKNKKAAAVEEEAEVEDLNAEVQGDEADDDMDDGAEGEKKKGNGGDNEKALFSGLRFFLSREVPFEPFEFAILALGGAVGWEGAGSPFAEGDQRITHQIVDREFNSSGRTRHATREYVQPQWIADSLNNNMLLPVDRYAPGGDLPAHLSPFVNDKAVGYIPETRRWFMSLQGKTVPTGAIESDDEVSDLENGDDDEYEEGEDILAQRRAAAFEDGDDEATTIKKQKQLKKAAKKIRERKAQDQLRTERLSGAKRGADGDFSVEDAVGVAVAQSEFEKEVEAEMAAARGESALPDKKKQKKQPVGKKKTYAPVTAEEESRQFAKMMMPNKQRKALNRLDKVKKNKKQKAEDLKNRKKQVDKKKK